VPNTAGSFNNIYQCVPNGQYTVSIALSSNNPDAQNYGVQFQIVNDFVPLSGTVSSTITSNTRHFYSIPVNAQSLQVTLNIANGPALDFIVFDGCNMQTTPGAILGNAAWNEQRVCYYGACTTSIPTRALSSLQATYYVILTSLDIPATSPRTDRDAAHSSNSAKPTSYTITASVGSANCAGSIGNGFCTAAIGFNGNVFTQATTRGTGGVSFWNFQNLTAKHLEAQCLYNFLSKTSCQKNSNGCQNALRVFSCFETFPLCDQSGFQLQPCVDVCNQVDQQCGFGWNINQNQYNCMSDRYVMNSSLPAGCTTITVVPTPTPTPPPVVCTTIPTDVTQFVLYTTDCTPRVPCCNINQIQTTFSKLINIQPSQFIINQFVQGNQEFTGVIVGSTCETSTSELARLINSLIDANFLNGLAGTCLDDAVLDFIYTNTSVPSYIINPNPIPVPFPVPVPVPVPVPNPNGPPQQIVQTIIQRIVTVNSPASSQYEVLCAFVVLFVSVIAFLLL
jgi:hypothetical protein